MKVFLSCSGPLSETVAGILRRYLPLMINDLDPFVSTHDVGSGSRWHIELMRELEDSSFGILCLTPDNLNSSWVLFEAGALTKHIEAKACGLLIGSLKPTDLGEPLSQFQHRSFSRDGFGTLLRDINAMIEKPLEAISIDVIVEKWWPDIDLEYEEALRRAPKEARRVPRDQRDILEEILTRIRAVENALLVPPTRFRTHARVSGDRRDVDRFLDFLKGEDLGARVSALQRYNENLAAVNLESEVPVDKRKLQEEASRTSVDLELREL